MKTIIAGSRNIHDLKLVELAIEESGFNITEVVCGGASGVDTLGRKWAANGHKVPVKIFPADWIQFGKSAGYRRNVDMANYGDALIAVWDGQSKGTKHMIDIARSKNLSIYIKKVKI